MAPRIAGGGSFDHELRFHDRLHEIRFPALLESRLHVAAYAFRHFQAGDALIHRPDIDGRALRMRRELDTGLRTRGWLRRRWWLYRWRFLLRRRRYRQRRSLLGFDKNPIQFPGRKRELHRTVGASVSVSVSVGVLGLRFIFQGPIQNLELRDLNPGLCECLVGRFRRFAHLEWAY